MIVETFARDNDDATGRTVGEVAAARGGEAFDTLLDVLRTGLSPRPFGDDVADWEARAEVWRNRDAVIGGLGRGRASGHGRAAARSAGRLDQHAGRVRDRRRAAVRRRDLRVSVVDPAGGGGDDLPRVGQPTGRDADGAVAARVGAGDRGMLRGAIEEALRWEPPISTVVRVAKRDCELGGIAIPEGTNVSVSVAAANRDPAHYPDPDRFDPTRDRTSRI